MSVNMTPELEEKWLAAAGKKANIANSLKEKIISSGEFIADNLNLSKVEEVLSGIDFSKPVTEVTLKKGKGVYVQFKGKYLGSWFTETGLTPDMVGLAEGKRLRTLFTPKSNAKALKSTARAIKDTWTPNRLIQSFNPRDKKYGQMTQGGGTQYLVLNPSSNMQEIK